MTEFKPGDKVNCGGRVAELIRPIISGMNNGQLWEVKFEALPYTVLRWIKPDSTLSIKTTGSE